MAFKFANSVRETTSGTPGTGTINLAGAVTGYDTFVARIGTGNTTAVTIEASNGTDFEHSIVTVTDATPDTLSNRTLLSSSTGALLDLSSGTHTVFCAWPAERAQQVNLEHVAGSDAAVTMTVGQMYVVDMSAWATADRTYTLPATAAVGDRVGIMVSAGNTSTFELLITANTGDTLNGIAGGTEWSRVFITGEVIIMRCIAANATWIVEADKRKPQLGVMRLSTSATTNESASTWTSPTAKSGVWTADLNIGNGCATANDRIAVRRAGNYSLIASAYPVNAVSDQSAYGVVLWKNGTSTLIGTMQIQASGTEALLPQWVGNTVTLAADDTVNYQYLSSQGSRQLAASSGLVSYFSVSEIL